MGKFKESKNWKIEMMKKRIDKIHYKKKLIKYMRNSLIAFEVDNIPDLNKEIEEMAIGSKEFEHSKILIPIYSYFKGKIDRLEEEEATANTQLDLLNNRKTKIKFI